MGVIISSCKGLLKVLETPFKTLLKNGLITQSSLFLHLCNHLYLKVIALFNSFVVWDTKGDIRSFFSKKSFIFSRLQR